jgi:hypothetical protein
MYFLTMRSLAVFTAASLIAVITIGLLLAGGNAWPAAILGGGAAFGGSLVLVNHILPPTDPPAESAVDSGPSSRKQPSR